MPSKQPRIAALTVSVWAFFVLGGFLAAWHGSSLPQGRAQEPRPGPTKLYFGVSACVDCHGKGTRLEDPLCRCTEVSIWEEKDKHKDAYKVLSEPLAQRMGELLKIDVLKDKSCVSCHGVVIQDESQRHRSFKESDGVSCVVCHGPYREWVGPHGLETERDMWRQLTRKEKEERYGMTDLWDPFKRAQLCLSCHVGNAAEGKVITHDMYAAGHPPLPSFELATFSEEMPRHWQLLGEKSQKVKALLQATADDTRFERTQLLLVSGALAHGSTLRLLEAEAVEARWPEFARLDCYACHHDLQSPGWRQDRKVQGKPGRAPLASWPMPLHKLGERLTLTREPDPGLTALRTELDRVPFGKASNLREPARKSAERSEALARTLAARKLTTADVLALLHELCRIAIEDGPDYDSARQIAWSFAIVHGELLADAQRGGQVPEAVLRNQDQVQRVLEELKTGLRLKLPSGKESITGQLDANLKTLYRYDPARFRAAFAQLKAALPPAGR